MAGSGAATDDSPSAYTDRVRSHLESQGWDLDRTHVSDTVFLLGGTTTADGEQRVGVIVVAAGRDDTLAERHLEYARRAIEKYDADVGFVHGRRGCPDAVARRCEEHGIRLIPADAVTGAATTSPGTAVNGDPDRGAPAATGEETADGRRVEGRRQREGDDSGVTRRSALVLGALGCLGVGGWYLLGNNGDTAQSPGEAGGNPPSGTPGSTPTTTGTPTDSGYSVPTGNERWHFQLAGEDGIFSEPVVRNGTVYVGSSDRGLYAVDTQEGREQWRYPMGAEVNSPAVADGTVYATEYDIGGDLHAVEATTGDEEWVFETTQRPTAPTATGGTVFVASYDVLHAVDAATGDEQWSSETEGGIDGAPVVVDGTVYVTSLDGVEAFDAATGDRQWYTELGANTAPAVADGLVYVCGGQSLIALDGTTGDEEWTYDKAETTYVAPDAGNGTVYVGDRSQTFYAVDAASGREVWTAPLDGSSGATPVVDGTVYVGSSPGLNALDAATGERQWTFETLTPRFGGGSPAVVDGAAYFKTVDYLYAVTPPEN